jgi:hypothetical protein
MLVPITESVGTGYNAGLTATAFAQQPDAYAGAGFTSPSGLPIGGLKLGADEAYRMVALAQSRRYSRGPAALGAASEEGYVPKDRAAPYLTEAEQAARSAGARLKSAWANPDCRFSLVALGVAAILLLRR